MENKTLQSVGRELAATAVFIGVTEAPVVSRFFAYLRAEGEERIRRYAHMVAEIYEKANGDLTELIATTVFEDENVYVRALARKEEVSPVILASALRELAVFSDFAALTPGDFAADMGVPLSALPSFFSHREELSVLFERRVRHIGDYGYGIFSSHSMFRLSDEHTIEPIVSKDSTTLAHFVGYEEERGRVLDNTRAFLEGRPAANVLLCGDAGTGKSSTVKAIANEFFEKGLRLIELRKDQLSLLPYVMGKISGNPLRFLIFIDDLSFGTDDDSFSMLKAALEGSASAKAPNAVIYATSNRRHLVRETFSSREGDDVHRRDTMEEMLSLSARFGLTVTFSRPAKSLYLAIVHTLATEKGIALPDEELDRLAEAFALAKGGRSARTAAQFVDKLLAETAE